MKVALVSTDFRNNDIEYNFQKIVDYSKKAKKAGAELIAFGEAFLQGFDALKWDYKIDKSIAVNLSSIYIRKIILLAKTLKITIGFGFYEKEKSDFYSSYLLIDDKGIIVDHFRRVSTGWKATNDLHYKEGVFIYPVSYKEFSLVTILCGDLWDDNIYQKVKNINPDIVLWPSYLSFTLEDWEREEALYLDRMIGLKTNVLFINSICNDIDTALGGCFYVSNEIDGDKLPFNKDSILYVEINKN